MLRARVRGCYRAFLSAFCPDLAYEVLALVGTCTTKAPGRCKYLGGLSGGRDVGSHYNSHLFGVAIVEGRLTLVKYCYEAAY